jgi:ketosteroid isomerase-like protein
MKANRIFLVLVTMIAAASVSLGQTKGNKPSGGNVRSAIEAASKGFEEALKKGQAARIADMYEKGARVMPPNGAMIQQRQQIQEFWQGFIDSGAKLSLSTSNVEAQGNVAIEVGTYEMISPDNSRDAGKFVVVWRRYRNGWKITIDIWNSDMPVSSK